MNGKISVVIPAYNCARYVAAAIDSVLRQSWQNFEIIVVDDGSTDDTAEVVRRYSSDGRLKYLFQENQGPGAARNAGIRLSEGDYICFLDSDDLMKEDSLMVRYEAINSSQDLTMIFSDYSIVDKDGEYIDDRLTKNKFLEYFEKYVVKKVNDVVFFDKNFIDLYFLFIPYPIWTGTVFFKKYVVDSIGYFRTDLKVSEDTDLWIRIAEKYLIGYVGKSTAIYNHHLSSLTKNNDEIYYIDRIKSLKNVNIYSKKIKKIINKSISESFFQLGYHYYYKNNRALAFKQYCYGYKYCLRNIKCLKGMMVSLLPLTLTKKLKSNYLINQS